MNFPQQGWGQPQQQQYAPQQQYAAAPAQAPQPVTQSVEDFWAENSGTGGGAPSFNFAPDSPQVYGKIVDMVARQRTEYSKEGGGAPKFYKDGRPQMQLEVTLQTDLRGWAAVKRVPTDANPTTGAPEPRSPELDDGKRRIFLWYTLRDAVAKAVTEAGKSAPAIGDMLGVRVSGTIPNPKGEKPILTYDAVLRPGSPASESFFAEQPAQQQAPQAPAPQAPPAQPTYASPQPAPPAAPQPAPPADGGASWGAAGSAEPPF